MKTRLPFLIIPFLVNIVLLMVLIDHPGLAAGTIRYVSPTGADSGACTNPATPCKTLTYAIGQAASGDELRLAAGTYGAASTTKSLTLKGGYTADFSSRDPAIHITNLSGGSWTTAFSANGQSNALIDVTLDGLTISNSVAWSGNSAGGVSTRYVNLTMENCRVQNNTGNSGAAGGVYLMESNAVIRHSQFLTNTSSSRGGGLYLYGSLLDRYTLVLENNLFQDNRGGYGGGAYLWGGVMTLRDNIFDHNTATAVGDVYEDYMVGGGFYIEDAQLLMQRNLIRNNIATQGSGAGGVIAVDRFWSDPEVTQQLENNVFIGNTLGNAVRYGAGLLLSDAEAALAHNTFNGNTGGDGSALTLVDDSIVTVTNAIVANQVTGMTVYTSSLLSANGILWHNNTQNTHNIAGTITLSNEYTGDPNFTADGYHLGAGSAALSRAVGLAVGDDVDGNVRPQGAASDLGADELLDVGLRLTKQASAAAFYTSATYVYTITVYNDGVNPASSLTLVDDLPLELRATAVSITMGSCTLDPAWGGVTSCNVGTLAASATVTLTLTVETAASTTGVLVTNAVVATATETQNSASLATPFHTCRTRLNAAPTTYSTVQDAIDAATSPTDVVKISGVCVGVNDYDGLAQLAYLDHSLTLQGGWNSDFTARDTALYPTTLNALGLGRVIYAHTGVSVTIEGLNLTGGNASRLGGASLNVTEGAGGALYAQYGAATVRDTTIYGNYASTTSGNGYGGGIAIYNTALTVTNSIIRENVASLSSNGTGGALYLYQDELNSHRNYDVLIQNSQLLTNTASVAGHAMGGALRMTYYYYGHVTLRDNVLRGNRAASGNGEGKGGGFYCSNSSNNTATRLERNQILYNEAASGDFSGYGGGVYADGCNLALSENTIEHNLAANTANSSYAGYGGGVYVTGGGTFSASEGMFTRNSLAYNTANPLGHGLGGGMYLASSAGVGSFIPPQGSLDGDRLRFNMAGASGYDSRGGGLYVYRVNPVLNNLLVTDNQAYSQGAGIYVDGSKITLYHATILSNTSGDGAGIRVAEAVIGLNTYTSTLELYNSIVATQTVGVSVNLANTAILDTNLWYGNTANTGGSGTIVNTNALSGDPRFAADGYHLLSASPAKDVAAMSPLGDDVDGEYRYGGYGYDLGADEYPAPAFRLSKTANTNNTATGEVITYTLVITSSGNVTATSVTLYDAIPAAARALSVQTTRGTCNAPGGWGVAVTCTLGDMPRLTDAVIRIAAQVTTTTPTNPPLALTNVVTATAPGEGDGTQRTASVTVLLSNCWAKVMGGAVYGSVQQAIDAAPAGGTVQIAGACYGVTTLGSLKQVASITGKPLTLEGGWNRDFTVHDAALYPTTLDAQQQGRVIYIKDTTAVTLTHLILQHGSSLGLGGGPSKIPSGTYDAGAGLYVNNANVNGRLVVQHCTLRENGTNARSYGGGAYIFKTYNRVLIEDTLFEGNGYYASNTPYNNGGGLCVNASDNVTLRHSRFIQNASAIGGGLLFNASSYNGWNTLLEALVFDGNRAYADGGGLYVTSGSTTGDATVRNLVVVNNQVGSGGTPGFYYSPNVAVNAFDHLTIANNTGGNGYGLNLNSGPYGGAYFTIRNLIVVSQTLGVYAGYDIHATLDGVLWHGNTANTGFQAHGEVLVTNARTGNPLFAADGYHITGPSPALDAGVAASVTGDFEGDARPVDDPLDPPDLGADEHKALIVTRPANATMTFGAARAKIVFSGGAPAGLDSITLAAFPGHFPTNRPQDDVISRTVIITPSAEVPFSATLSLGYAEDETHGLDENSFNLYRWTGNGWQSYPGARDTAKNIVSADVNHFSGWAIGTGTPTVITLRHFGGHATPWLQTEWWLAVLCLAIGLLGTWAYRRQARM